MARRSKPRNTSAAADAAASQIEQRQVPRYSIGRWTGKWVLWRNDGTVISWHDTLASAVDAIAEIDEKLP